MAKLILDLVQTPVPKEESMSKKQEKQASASSQVIDALQGVLADTYVLLAATQNVHWNVEGPLFHAVHLMTDEQYENLFDATDELAERIRSLGARVHATLAGHLERASLKEPGSFKNAVEMVRRLADGHTALAERARQGVAAAQEAGDEATADMLIERIAVHDKFAWMLRSLIA
ncbi:MAG: General stress protein 20U [Myxococcota bacterium]|nr:General stress protein 20U [Myxococcota bacterium]